jgi:hypothetical protein
VFCPRRAQDQSVAFPNGSINLAQYCRISMESHSAPIARVQ